MHGAGAEVWRVPGTTWLRERHALRCAFVIHRTAGAVRARTAPWTDRAAHAAAEALGQRYFGPNFDEAVFEHWAARCRDILFVAEERATGRFLGYADQMMLAPATAAQLRAGTISEASFDERAVLGDAEVKSLPPGSTVTMYLAGMCVEAPGTPLGRRAAMALRACRRRLLSQWRARGLTVVMLLCAATPAGRRLAERSGGRLIGAGAERADGYDLYELTDLPTESALQRRRLSPPDAARGHAAASCSPQPLQKRDPTSSMLVPHEAHRPGK
jgi:hypothetical protein